VRTVLNTAFVHYCFILRNFIQIALHAKRFKRNNALFSGKKIILVYKIKLCMFSILVFSMNRIVYQFFLLIWMSKKKFEGEATTYPFFH
jgi:hypothetical protein